MALAVHDLDATIRDSLERLGAAPIVVVPGKYALWRTLEVNLSVNSDGTPTERLRHSRFEDDQVTEKTRWTEVNRLMWGAFNPDQQDHEIIEVYGPIA